MTEKKQQLTKLLVDMFSKTLKVISSWIPANLRCFSGLFPKGIWNSIKSAKHFIHKNMGLMSSTVLKEKTSKRADRVTVNYGHQKVTQRKSQQQ